MSSIETRPSALFIGPKRSGTNLGNDVLAPIFDATVNEPLGLHNDTHSPGGKNNPLDPWKFSSAEHVSAEFGHKDLVNDQYGSLLTKSFLGWLKDGGKLIKETDFLYLGWLLASVPLKPIAIKRDPRDSIASYRKHDLYKKWGFQEKMHKFADTVTQSPVLDNLYGGAFRAKNFMHRPEHQQLAIYYSIALSEIDRNTKDYGVFKTTYEEIVYEPIPAFQRILNFLNVLWNEQIANAILERTSSMRDPGVHGTFRRREDLTTFTQILTSDEEADIRSICSDFGIALPKAKTFFLPRVAEIIPREKNEARLASIEQVKREDQIKAVKNRVVESDLKPPLYVSSKLVTNLQYGYFLKWLVDNDIPLSLNGKPLFYNNRPQGNIRRNGRNIQIEQGYAVHPVNFVNWIGAASYSVWVGGRLPTSKEWEIAICPDEINLFKITGEIDAKHANIGQFYSGTTPVTFFPPNKRGIYDALGNVSIWTHGKKDASSYEKMKAGLEWNHTKDRGVLPHPRPFWFGASGLGVRPVFDSLTKSISEELLLSKLRKIVDFVISHQNDPANANKELFAKFDELFAYNK